MTKRWMILCIVMVSVAVSAAMIGPVMSNVELPSYTVTASDGDIEIRQYTPMIIAEVQVEGERREAIGDGFRLLADFIFGNNTVQQEIAMTAPVQQQQSTEIAMTAPVRQQGSGTSWTVSFVMPSHFTMDTLPKPNNDQVTIKQVPGKKYVAIQFSGTASEDNLSEHTQELMAYISENNLKTIGTLKYAFYNPPWTLPFMRRNEVMIEIE